MESDDYVRMLKLVCYIPINDWLYHVKLLFSSCRGLTVLEEMIHLNSRLLFQIGLIAN
jgi:hypothetical protein